MNKKRGFIFLTLVLFVFCVSAIFAVYQDGQKSATRADRSIPAANISAAKENHASQQVFQEQPQLRHETTAVNIEVPVRVFRGNEFVDNLTIDDFIVYQDGIPQQIAAVYLVKKTTIERKNEPHVRFKPAITRNFVLYFEILDWLPEIGNAVKFFFKNVIDEGDGLTVVSPMKTYHLRPQNLKRLPPEKISEEIINKLRKDTQIRSWPLKSIMADIGDLSGGRMQSVNSAEVAGQLSELIKDLKYLDETKMLKFADTLKNMEGQKQVFLFYQKDIMPSLWSTDGQSDISSVLSRLAYGHEQTFNVDKIKKAFSDSSIGLQFIYITKIQDYNLDVSQPRFSAAGRTVISDQSAGVYSAFKEMAIATGGTVDASANVEASFQKAVNASENYYLLYYTPEFYSASGKFHTIEVKVKLEGLRVTHRAGYFSN
ncbi:MAG: hypothetical protein JXB26_00740 [Candidatus Aminicenantes bacterium]|nr:hypothetical protein [Candidatus Aminicenantes bacterium]